MDEEKDVVNNEGTDDCDTPVYMYKSIPEFYNRVRSSLNVGNSISDEEIDFFENAPIAEMKVKQRIVDFENIPPDKMQLVETCIVYMTCYGLCPKANSQRRKRQKDPSLEIEFATINSNEKPCERFLDLVNDLLAEINGDTEGAYSSFIGFEVTSGNTNKCCRPWGWWWS